MLVFSRARHSLAIPAAVLAAVVRYWDMYWDTRDPTGPRREPRARGPGLVAGGGSCQSAMCDAERKRGLMNIQTRCTRLSRGERSTVMYICTVRYCGLNCRARTRYISLSATIKAQTRPNMPTCRGQDEKCKLNATETVRARHRRMRWRVWLRRLAPRFGFCSRSGTCGWRSCGSAARSVV